MQIYHTSRWKKKRASILKRDKYLCRRCSRYGKRREATTVHHAFPYEFYPELAWKDDNLISLCESCHNAMHERETHQLTSCGIWWKEKVSPLLFPSNS